MKRDKKAELVIFTHGRQKVKLKEYRTQLDIIEPD